MISMHPCPELVRRLARWLLRLLPVFAVLASLNAAATTLLPLSLEQLSSKAELIFYGSVIDNEVVREGGRIATLTRFEVHEQIKGPAGKTHTIKQIGGQLPDGRDFSVHAVPRYKPGESYVIFLPAPSSMGFSSPLGLHQGNFIVSEKDGTKTVSNGRSLAGNASGAAAAAPLATRPDDVTQADLDAFIGTVRAYTRQ